MTTRIHMYPYLHVTCMALFFLITQVSADSLQMDGPTNANTDWIEVAMCRTHCFRKVWLSDILDSLNRKILYSCLLLNILFFSFFFGIMYVCVYFCFSLLCHQPATRNVWQNRSVTSAGSCVRTWWQTIPLTAPSVTTSLLV